MKSLLTALITMLLVSACGNTASHDTGLLPQDVCGAQVLVQEQTSDQHWYARLVPSTGFNKVCDGTVPAPWSGIYLSIADSACGLQVVPATGQLVAQGFTNYVTPPAGHTWITCN